jgi:hypothetical protein
MEVSKICRVGLGALLLCLAPATASAGAIELSIGASFNRSNYSETSYAWTRRLGFSVGYHLTELSEIEIAFQDVIDRTFIQDYQDTTFHDEVYSANWVQSLTGKESVFQPYFKVGVGQLRRTATGSYASGAAPPSEIDSLTAILGAGLRIYITKTFAIRGEATTYLTGGALGTWQDNYALQAGVSWFF